MNLKFHDQVNPAWGPDKVEGLALKYVKRTLLMLLVIKWGEFGMKIMVY